MNELVLCMCELYVILRTQKNTKMRTLKTVINLHTEEKTNRSNQKPEKMLVCYTVCQSGAISAPFSFAKTVSAYLHRTSLHSV